VQGVAPLCRSHKAPMRDDAMLFVRIVNLTGGKNLCNGSSDLLAQQLTKESMLWPEECLKLNLLHVMLWT